MSKKWVKLLDAQQRYRDCVDYLRSFIAAEAPVFAAAQTDAEAPEDAFAFLPRGGGDAYSPSIFKFVYV